MVETIRHAAKLTESRAQFVAEAEAARKAMLMSGEGYDAEEVHAHLRKRDGGSGLKISHTDYIGDSSRNLCCQSCRKRRRSAR
jgi:hypothetical protein